VIRLVAPLTVTFGVLTLVAALAMSMIAVPLAMATMVAGFCWSVERPGRGAPCSWCHAGCVECRERIELGAH
jgi:hypothetical protein